MLIHRRHKKILSRGMTLVELLVVLGLFVIVASLTIFDYGRFRSSVSLQNLADDISLSIRRTQNYAIGVKSTQSSVFSNGYGISFSTAASNPGDMLAPSSKAFIIFADINGNKLYDHTLGATACGTPSSGDECVEVLSITSADAISKFCTYSSGASTCTDITSGFSNISFLRPNPDAFICAGPTGGACGTFSSVDIVIQNAESKTTKTINVSNVGEISIR